MKTYFLRLMSLSIYLNENDGSSDPSKNNHKNAERKSVSRTHQKKTITMILPPCPDWSRWFVLLGISSLIYVVVWLVGCHLLHFFPGFWAKLTMESCEVTWSRNLSINPKTPKNTSTLNLIRKTSATTEISKTITTQHQHLPVLQEDV